MILLLAAGTGYDLHLRNVEGKRRVRAINCTTYASNANTNQKYNTENVKLDMPDNIAKNGIVNITIKNKCLLLLTKQLSKLTSDKPKLIVT